MISLGFGALASTLFPLLASAADPPSGYLPRFELQDGRSEVSAPELDLIRFAAHGEYQLRAQLQSNPPLRAPTLDPSANSLGQDSKILQWLRFTPQLQVTTRAEIIGQIDLLRGLAAGATTRYIDAAANPESYANPITLDARWLYLEIPAKAWKLRIGQQPLYLGAGMLFNDGDHPSLFGDYQRGDSAERIHILLRPGGRIGKLTLWAAGDLIYRDAQAQLLKGDLAWQGMGGIKVGTDTNQIGATGILRSQRRRSDASADPAHLEQQNLSTIDFHGTFATKAPSASMYLFGEGEFALQRGQREEQTKYRVAAWGTALRLGIAHEALHTKERFANFVVKLEWGYASGDDDPNDGVDHRFAMNSNYKVGLILFDLLIHTQTARSATLLRNAALALPAGQALSPTNGSIAGATYVNPTIVLRPSSRLDLKAGILVAQATSDLVDVYAFAEGRRQNHLGGRSERRDLGLELDAGVEWRYPLSYGMQLQLGAQAGVLFPGMALSHENDLSLPNQYLAVSRIGFQY